MRRIVADCRATRKQFPRFLLHWARLCLEKDAMTRSRTTALAVICGALAGTPAGALQLKSDSIAEGMQMAQAQAWPACKGDNISPALSWSGAPAATKSFAVTAYDPTARGGRGFWHWTLYDIPADLAALPADAGAADGTKAPDGAKQGTNGWGVTGSGGPCPPPGQTHRYIFTLWALDTAELAAGNGADDADLRPQLQLHALSKATITARYGR
jgi:Raf kinase inhibitor-like YbhB/YbcL family protein